LARGLGNIRPSRKNGALVDELRPRNITQATPNSQSSRYGLGEFPFHTDGAALPDPPNYIALRSIGGFNASARTKLILLRKSLLLDSEFDALRDDVWVVNGGYGRFYSSIISEAPDGLFLRFDRNVMRPLSTHRDSSPRILEEVVARSGHELISWSFGKTLVIDNRRCLHARECASSEDADQRVLERVYIY
jgi:hypothetical protein